MNDDQPKMHRSRDGDALYQACEREGCPICLVTLERMGRVMDFWQYEWASEMENRQVLLRSKGFCSRHTWQLALAPNMPTPFALAMVYRSLLPDLLEEIQHDLQRLKTKQTTPRRRIWSQLAFWRRGQNRSESAESARFFQGCPFCQRQTEIERELVQELLTQLSSEAFLAQLNKATGFCLSHLAQTTRAAQTAAQRTTVLECQQTCLQRNLKELDELVRKHDYRFLKEPRGEEMTAWRRAAELLVGNNGVH